MRPEPCFPPVHPFSFVCLAAAFCTLYTIICSSLQHHHFLANSITIIHSPLCIPRIGSSTHTSAVYYRALIIRAWRSKTRPRSVRATATYGHNEWVLYCLRSEAEMYMYSMYRAGDSMPVGLHSHGQRELVVAHILRDARISLSPDSRES
ncbi:hypothetical protein HD554DRAFT_559146 [Boletus coccyginus]|nr:hypothetical protein HD554DRAFT_559146 [Boletus coccyginus]